MKRKKYFPIRTCVYCRRKADKKELIRFVLQNDVILIDKVYNMDGRGVYLCTTCFDIYSAQSKEYKKLHSRMHYSLNKRKK